MMIRNIWAAGRNYRDHAQEMQAAIPTEPLVFLKAGSCASINSNQIELPYWTEEVHFETELALRLSSSLQVIEGAVALDLTERKLQSKAKQKGEPWTLSKSFTGACAVSAFFTLRKWEEMRDLRIRLWVNDQLRQDARSSEMIFDCETLTNHIFKHFPVCGGDLILTGTPAGVGPLNPGDKVKAEIEGQITHFWNVTKEKAPN